MDIKRVPTKALKLKCLLFDVLKTNAMQMQRNELQKGFLSEWSICTCLSLE